MQSNRQQTAAAIAWKIIRALWRWLRKPQNHRKGQK